MHIWFLIHGIQMIAFICLFNLDFPVNVRRFNGYILKIAKVELIEGRLITNQIFNDQSVSNLFNFQTIDIF